MRTSLLSAIAAAATVGVAANAAQSTFAPDAISTNAVEYGAVIDPKDGAAYFIRQDAPWGTPGCGRLMKSEPNGAGWNEAVTVFGGDACLGDPFISSDGEILFLTSTAHDDHRTDADIWFARRTENGWSAPQRVAGVNSPKEEFSPVLVSGGSLYFASDREGGLGQGDIYIAAPTQTTGEFATPRNLGAPVNTAGGEWNVLVDPAGTYMIFEASGRTDGRSASGDLYYAAAGLNGDWSAPVNLRAINTEGSELMARLHPDGRTLLYTSTLARNGKNADIVAASLAEILPAGELIAVSRSAHELVTIDRLTLAPIRRDAIGEGAHEIALSADARFAYAPAYGVFPAPHEKPIAPGPLTFHDRDTQTLTAIDLSSGARRDIPICRRSHGVLATGDDHIWVTCEEEARILELDPNDGAILKTWPAKKGVHQLAATADGNYVIAANTDHGSITIIDRTHGASRNVRTRAGAEGLAVAPGGDVVWVGNAQDNSISVVDIRTGVVKTTFASGGRFPVKLAFDTDGREVWVVNTFSRSIAIFDAATLDQLDMIEFDTPPLGILFAPEGGEVYITFPRKNEISVFDVATRVKTGTVQDVMEGDGMAVRLKP